MVHGWFTPALGCTTEASHAAEWLHQSNGSITPAALGVPNAQRREKISSGYVVGGPDVGPTLSTGEKSEGATSPLLSRGSKYGQ